MLLLASMTAFGPDPSRQKAAKLERGADAAVHYLIYLPADYEQKSGWPLMLFLHGAGERGDDLKDVKTHGPPRMIERGKDFPFVVVSPQCPEKHRWDAKALTALIDDVVKTHKIDQDRICVTGLSMGGYGTWALAAETPDRFAALAPICGGGDPTWAPRLAHLPIWVFHGAKDSVVSLKRSQEMVDAIKANKGDVRFTVYPDADHDSWTATYDNQEVYEWLLVHRRKPAAK